MLAAVGLSLVGCQSAPDKGNKIVAVEANDLGITQLEIDHGSVSGEPLLTLRGLDGAGAEITTATLRTGMVWDGAAAGTELILGVGKENMSFVSPDREAHELPEPRSFAPLVNFVRLRDVAAEMDAEAGIRFRQSESGSANGEVAFTVHDCDPAGFQTVRPKPTDCCEEDDDAYHTSWAVNPQGALVTRSKYGPNNTLVCRKSDGTAGCTTDCYYGPCGYAVLSSVGSQAAVFHPSTGDSVCGFQTWLDYPLYQWSSYPEMDYGQDTLYPGADHTCSACSCNSDGTTYCNQNSLWAGDPYL